MSGRDVMMLFFGLCFVLFPPRKLLPVESFLLPGKCGSLHQGRREGTSAWGNPPAKSWQGDKKGSQDLTSGVLNNTSQVALVVKR